MPVVSPSRYTPTTSTLTGSYRSTLTSSSSIDKPYYRTSSGTYVTSTLRSSYGDRTTEYRSRYSEVDGKRERKTSLVEYSRNNRAPSVTESDSGRYRSERSESRSRDVSTTRSESSRTSDLNRGKRNVISTAALAMSTAELYNKYSPANYVPLTQRIQQQSQNNYGEISRSKSISNDIGRPPAPDSRSRKPRNSAATISEVNMTKYGKYQQCHLSRVVLKFNGFQRWRCSCFSIHINMSILACFSVGYFNGIYIFFLYRTQRFQKITVSDKLHSYIYLIQS